MPEDLEAGRFGSWKNRGCVVESTAREMQHMGKRPSTVRRTRERMDPYFLIAIIMVPAALLAIWGTFVGQRIRKQEIAMEMLIKEAVSDFENTMNNTMNGFLHNLSGINDPNQRSQDLRAMLQWLKTIYVDLESELREERQSLETNSRLRKRKPGLFENAQDRLARRAELLPKIDRHMKSIANMLASEAVERPGRLQ